MEKAFTYSREVVVEEFIQGKELTVAIMQDGGMAVALPVINIVPHSGVYDFHSKYTKGETEYLVPAPLDKERQGMCRNWLLQPTRFWDAVVLRVWM